MAWLAGWAKRVKLTIDQNDVDALLSNFPSLIYVSASSGRNAKDISFVFDELTGGDADRHKIAVTLADGDTEIYVEVERWDSGAEKAWLWTKVSSIASGADTDIYLYYDREHADNDAYVGDVGSVPGKAVWDGQFFGVWHMQDATDTTVADSTSAGRTGTKAGVGSPVEIDGQIGKAQDYDGSNDYVNLGDFYIQSGLTLSARVKRDGTGDDDYCTLIGKPMPGYPGSEWMLFFNKTTGVILFRVRTNEGGMKDLWTVASIPVNTWTMVTGTWDGTNMKVFINGTQVAGPLAQAGSITNYATNAYLGMYAQAETHPADLGGILDECRIADYGWTSAWDKATYETGRDDFIAYGDEELGWVDHEQEISEKLGLLDSVDVAYGQSVPLTEQLGLLDTVVPTRYTHKISGTCTVAAVPVEGAVVTVIDQDTHLVDGYTTSDALGEFEFKPLDPTHHYHVAARYEALGTKYNVKSLWELVPIEEEA